MAVEYYRGCWRSHARLVSVPLRPPFSVAVSAHTLPNRSVALACRVRLNLPCGVLLTSAQRNFMGSYLLLHDSSL